MKYKWKETALILGLFIVSIVVGVFVSNQLSEDLPYGVQPFANEGIKTSFYVFGLILLVTAVFLVLVKKKFTKFLRIWFYFVLFFATAIALSSLMADWIAVIVSLSLLILYFEKDFYLMNFVHIIVFAGVSAMFSLSFDLLSTIVLLSIIAIYDIVSVFLTKHMVKLAKAQGEIGIFAGIIVPIKKSFAFIGGGDIVFPTILIYQIYRYFGLYATTFSIIGATLGLFILIFLGKEKEVYPAIPTIFSGTLLGFLLSFF